MAWTKIQTAIVVGAAVLLTGGVTTLVVNEVSSQAYDQPTIDESLWQADSRILEKVPPVLIIRPTKSPYSNGREDGIDQGDKAVWMNTTISGLLRVAYGFPNSPMILPNALSKQRFDLMLTVTNHPKETLQAEIKKRFGLVGHTETLNTNIFLLKVRNTNAPGLIPIYGAKAATYGASRGAPINLPPGSGGRWMESPNETLANFAIYLEFKLKQMVRNQTGLTGHYEIQLRWQAKDGEADNDAFKRAVLEQLGLELVSTNMPVEMLVVEKVK